MSAIISSDVQMKEILKATGFDCPVEMENETFEQATSGGGKWYCYRSKNSPYTGYYFKEEIPDADTPFISAKASNDLTLALSSLRERHPYDVSVICKNGVITVSYKNSASSSSSSSYTLHRSPDKDLDLG